MEREKRLEELKNEKRMIELEVGMKKMVFEGVKEKVKGMNSEQLMMRVCDPICRPCSEMDRLNLKNLIQAKAISEEISIDSWKRQKIAKSQIVGISTNSTRKGSTFFRKRKKQL